MINVRGKKGPGRAGVIPGEDKWKQRKAIVSYF